MIEARSMSLCLWEVVEVSRDGRSRRPAQERRPTSVKMPPFQGMWEQPLDIRGLDKLNKNLGERTAIRQLCGPTTVNSTTHTRER